MKRYFKSSFILVAAALLAVLTQLSREYGPFTFSSEKTTEKQVAQGVRNYPAPAPMPQETFIFPQTMAEAAQPYNGINMHQVPRVFVEELPADWQIRSNEDKTLFMKIITAQILRTNAHILAEKKRLHFLEEKYLRNQPWTPEEETFFNQLLQKYDIFLAKKREGQLHELIGKVDIIPPSIAVAQAAFFSDWGQKNKKALFGEYGWVNDQYVPLEFKTISEASDSFARQINSRSQLFQFHEKRRLMIPYQNDRYISESVVDALSQFMDWDKEYLKKLKETYLSGYFLQLDHARFEQNAEKPAEEQKNKMP